MVLINLVLMPRVNYKRRAAQRATRVHASQPMLNIFNEYDGSRKKCQVPFFKIVQMMVCVCNYINNRV
jgi:hypothetical protein